MVINNQDIDTKRIIHEMEDELSHLMDYWIKNVYDIDNGGFIGGRDFYNQIITGEEKGLVLTARILWTFSAVYNHNKKQELLDNAQNAYKYLIDYFWDKENGGFFWAVNENGQVSSSRKQIYAQGFAIYGLSEYYKATNNKEALDYAIQTFNLIEEKSFDAQDGGYLEALSSDWKHLDDMRLSEKDDNTPKSMNTHLHILEPYTNLYRVWQDNFLLQKIKDLLEVFSTKILNKETFHYELFFDMDWSLQSNIVSYGHDIEGSWLMTEAAYETKDDQLITETEAIDIKMVDITINEGMDSNGSIFYEKKGDHLDTDKHWWPQAEAMVGLAYAWKISGKDKYLQQMAKTWDFIKENMIDKERGEWYWRVDKAGEPYTSEVKLGFWKCPYHNSRALMEVIKILGA